MRIAIGGECYTARKYVFLENSSSLPASSLQFRCTRILLRTYPSLLSLSRKYNVCADRAAFIRLRDREGENPQHSSKSAFFRILLAFFMSLIFDTFLASVVQKSGGYKTNKSFAA